MQVVEYDFLGKPTFAESKGASHIPSTNHFITDLYDDVADELAASIPVDDLSLLTSHDPQIHTKALYQLGKAYAKWGFFMLTNDETLEKLVEDVKKKSREFHDFPVEEKEFSDKCPFTPIRYGTNFYPEAENVHYWRDYLKVITFPEFNFPQKPPGYRGVARKFLEGIS
ncbi:Feruloyl CoA ortho-hydroxylase 2 [Glycine max]|nr:Feruloyl CoA ortho-hydroxylase 2 [Glycine max]